MLVVQYIYYKNMRPSRKNTQTKEKLLFVRDLDAKYNTNIHL